MTIAGDQGHAASNGHEPLLLPPSLQQQEFSLAYIHAISAVAGYSTEVTRVDMDGVDLEIKMRNNADPCPRRDRIAVQLKCTYATSPTKGILHYALDMPTYDRLRRPTCNPTILVVVHVPRQSDLRLEHGGDSLTLRHLAYWHSLLGMPIVSNSTSITLSIPTGQAFTVQWLSGAMSRLAQDGKI